MRSIDVSNVVEYVESHIGDFHRKRIESLDKLSLDKVLLRKNPYLFRTKNILTSEQIVRELMDAHISSNEETLFGEWLEGLAIFVNTRVFNGRKSGITGIDLEMDKNNTRYLVNIKSGPNWGNSDQIKQMRSNFVSAKRTLKTSGSSINIVCINGCCYGRSTKIDKDDHQKLCGQKFWEFISGDENFYLDIVEPLGHKAKERNQEFANAYARRLNLFTREFGNNFCDEEGSIDWGKLVKFNSSAQKPPKSKSKPKAKPKTKSS